MSDQFFEAMRAEAAPRYRNVMLLLGLIGGILIGSVIAIAEKFWPDVLIGAACGTFIGVMLPTDESHDPVRGRLLDLQRWSRSLPVSIGIAMAALSVVLTTTLYLALGAAPLYVAFYLFEAPIVLCAFLFGTRSGFLAAALGALSVIYYAIPPSYSLALHSTHDVINAVGFTLAAFGTAALIAIQSEFSGLGEERAALSGPR